MEKVEEAHHFSILMFPWLAHGHIFPYLELAKRLASKKTFTVYLCSTAVNLDSLKAGDDVKLVELTMESSELPPELHTTKNLPFHLLPTLLRDVSQHLSLSFVSVFNSLKPDLLIYDFFQPWAAKHALIHGIPCVNFVPAGATACTLNHHLYTYKSRSTFPFQGILSSLPNHDDYNDSVLDLTTPLVKDADDSFSYGTYKLSSEFVMLKSCRGFEQKYIDYLTGLGQKPVVITGPLIAHSNNGDLEDPSGIMEFLNRNDIGVYSTVYVSFGSECFLSKEQIHEIAKGLQLCKPNFVWVIRFPAADGEKDALNAENALPNGFIESVKGRGLVVWKWAPQMRILAHPSLGGFVSHCGWSSVNESMYFGVPVIAMPMQFDQPINAGFMVEAGLAEEVFHDDTNGHGRLYKGEEIAKAIDKVVADNDMRDRAKYWSEKIKENEERDEDEAAEQLLRLCLKNKQQVLIG